MWPKLERTIRASELTEVVASVVDKLAERQFDERSAAHLVGARTLLVRDAEGLFSFVHQSILEWLVASRAAEQIRAGSQERRAVDALKTAKMSPLMADFFCSLAGSHAEPWAQDVLGTMGPGLGDVAKENALLVLKRLGKDARASVQLARDDLRGQDFSGQQLPKSNFAGADLAEARFIGTDLTGANLEGARLIRGGPDLREARGGASSMERWPRAPAFSALTFGGPAWRRHRSAGRSSWGLCSTCSPWPIATRSGRAPTGFPRNRPHDLLPVLVQLRVPEPRR
jgi:hypothetical protein